MGDARRRVESSTETPDRGGAPWLYQSENKTHPSLNSNLMSLSEPNSPHMPGSRVSNPVKKGSFVAYFVYYNQRSRRKGLQEIRTSGRKLNGENLWDWIQSKTDRQTSFA